LLFKSPGDWSSKQTERAIILFQLYPNIKKASKIVQQLRNIYNQTTDIRIAYTKLAHWYKLAEESGFKAFNIVAKSITLNYKSILNYFTNISTNASAKSFNAKIKTSRAQFRGVKNIESFLNKLTDIFAWSTTSRLDP
jgi:transposase